MSNRTQVITLVLLVLTVFGVSIAGDFVWDDRALTVSNGALAGSAVDALSTPFLVDGTGTGAYWRPVVTLALWTQVQVFGDDPAGYHLINLLLHGGITLLVFGWLRRRLGEGGLAPWLGAGLFAVHTTRPESVAWIAGSTDLWMTLFLLLALRVWERRETAGHCLATGMLLALALWSKETAVVALPILLLEMVFKGGWKSVPWRDISLAGGPIAVALVIRLVMGGAGEGGEPFIDRLMLAFSALGYYGQLLIWPGDLTVQVGSRVVENGLEVFPVLPLIGGAVFSLFLGGLWWTLGRIKEGRAEARTEWLWVVLPLFPVLHLLPLGTPWVASARYLYLPMLGVVALLGRAIRGGNGKWLGPLVGVLIGGFGFASAQHVTNFQTDESLWTVETERHPESATAWENLGHAYYRQGKKDEASRAWSTGLERVEQHDERGIERLGLLVLREAAARMPPWDSKGQNGFANAYQRLVEGEEIPWSGFTSVQREGALRLRQVDAPELLWIPAAVAAQGIGDIEKAASMLARAQQSLPTSELVWAERQRTAALAGDWNAVASLLGQARAAMMNPDWGGAWEGHLSRGKEMADRMPLPPDAPPEVGEKLKRVRVIDHLGCPAWAYRILNEHWENGLQGAPSGWITRIQIDVRQGGLERAMATLASARTALPASEAQWQQLERQLQQQLQRAVPAP